MTIDKDRRRLLQAATALGLSVGISASSITHAAFDSFLKIGDIKGESKGSTAKGDENWKPVEAKVKGNKLILRDKQGKTKPARNGTYHLSDGSVVVVKNGKVIRHKKAGSKDARDKSDSNRLKATKNR